MFFLNKVSTDELRNSKIVAQELTHDEDTALLDRLMTIDELADGLKMRRDPVKSSTSDFSFVIFVQDRSQNNQTLCINKRAWTTNVKSWIAMVTKVTPSWTKLSLMMKHKSIITSRRINARNGMKMPKITHQENCQKSTIGVKMYVNRFEGLRSFTAETKSGYFLQGTVIGSGATQ